MAISLRDEVSRRAIGMPEQPQRGADEASPWRNSERRSAAQRCGAGCCADARERPSGGVCKYVTRWLAREPLEVHVCLCPAAHARRLHRHSFASTRASSVRRMPWGAGAGSRRDSPDTEREQLRRQVQRRLFNERQSLRDKWAATMSRAGGRGRKLHGCRERESQMHVVCLCARA